MRQVVPNKTEMERYIERGLTQAQIAKDWSERTNTSVSRSAIAMAIQRYGLTPKRTRPRYEDTIPWRVRDEHKHHRDAKMLRLAGRFMRGLSVSEEDRRRLASWRRLLAEMDAVITYDPDTEEGFWWVARDVAQGDDENDLIRRPKTKAKG